MCVSSMTQIYISYLRKQILTLTYTSFTMVHVSSTVTVTSLQTVPCGLHASLCSQAKAFLRADARSIDLDILVRSMYGLQQVM